MPTTSHIIHAKRLFPGGGNSCISDIFISVANGKILSVSPVDDRQPSLEVDTICPGYIDLQLNGARDIKFNFNTSKEAIAEIGAGAREGGTAHFLPTFVTAPDQEYQKAIDSSKDAIKAKTPGVLGTHLEGPFLSKKRPGVHLVSAIRSLDPDDFANITADYPGVMLLTLAPNEQNLPIITDLRNKGVVVFAGHSDASADIIWRAEQHGLVGATHLFNAMSQIGPREPGLVGAVFGSQTLIAGIIADGIHVHPANLKLASQVMDERLFLVTDSSQTLAGKLTSFDVYGQTITLKDGCLTNEHGRLAGAHLAMDQAVRNMIRMAEISTHTAIDMASTRPAKAIGLGGELGYIKPGYRASMTILDDDLYAKGVMIDGQLF